MENKKYKYDAFISYRHSELDKYVAENLHKILENYELPKNLKEKLGVEGKVIKRVFRDQEELPLSSNLEDPIVTALKNSKYLIVICSPRLRESLWCKKEIETFKKLRGRENIFCVLIEGEPSESFPEEVLYDNVKGKKVPVEPLAADVRGTTKKEVLKKIKEEKLRLIASMLNIDYDDLRQRHKQREQKRKMMIVGSIALFFILFSLYSSIMLIKINSQQKKLKLNQAINLSNDSMDYLKEDNRYDAIKSSYEALTKYNGVKMPYTSEAEYSLSESLGMYDVGFSFKATNQLKTKGVIDYIKDSNNDMYGASYDESETLTLFDTKTLKKIKEYYVGGLFYEESFTFIGDNKLAYITDKGNINIVNTKDGKLVKEIKRGDDRFIGLQSNKEETTLVYTDGKILYLYNLKDNKEIGRISTNDKYLRKIYFNYNGEYVFASTMINDIVVDKQEKLTIHTINVSEAKEVNSKEFDAGYINGIATREDNVYILLNNTLGSNFNSLVISYNYKNGTVNWDRRYDGLWGKFISKSFPEGTNHIVVVTRKKIFVLDEASGNESETFSIDNEVINIYSFLDEEMYLTFLSNGAVNYVNMNKKSVLEYQDKYMFNVDEYKSVIRSKKGFILLPNNDNRIILYEQKSNKDVKQEDMDVIYAKDESISSTDFEKIKDNYKINNINLVERCFYSKDKKLLFVNYTNADLAIYDTDSKALINKLDNLGNVYHYFGKDKYGRTYIGDMSNSYVLDKDFNKVGHIQGLCKLTKNKVYILHSSKMYSLKIYSLDDLLKEAKKYLDKE